MGCGKIVSLAPQKYDTQRIAEVFVCKNLCCSALRAGDSGFVPKFVQQFVQFLGFLRA